MSKLIGKQNNGGKWFGFIPNTTKIHSSEMVSSEKDNFHLTNGLRLIRSSHDINSVTYYYDSFGVDKGINYFSRFAGVVDGFWVGKPDE